MRAFATVLVTAVVAALAAEAPLIQPKDLAGQLAAKARPAIFQVGPNLMYRSRRIPGAIYAGQASRPDGLNLLRSAVEKLARDRDIVLYCGCCPWDNCPNISPAMAMLKQMGFTRVKALYLANNFKADWTDRGYPVEP